MAEIAAGLRRALADRAAAGSPGAAALRVLAEGRGWRVADVLCTFGPRDRPFEEAHPHVDLAVVAAGTFLHRSAAGRALLTPGAVLLGNADEAFECAHDHAAGDRCLSFQLDPDLFASLCAEMGVEPRFRRNRLPPLRELAPVIARALAALGAAEASWEDLTLEMVMRTMPLLAAGDGRRLSSAPPNVEARVAHAVRAIDARPQDEHRLAGLAAAAGLSRYHFLRTFQAVTGLTPHRYLVRARLRLAALRLAQGADRIVDVAYDSGFGDLSNFNHAFRAEFGTSPRRFRRRAPSR